MRRAGSISLLYRAETNLKTEKEKYVCNVKKSRINTVPSRFAHPFHPLLAPVRPLFKCHLNSCFTPFCRKAFLKPFRNPFEPLFDVILTPSLYLFLRPLWTEMSKRCLHFSQDWHFFSATFSTLLAPFRKKKKNLDTHCRASL